MQVNAAEMKDVSIVVGPISHLHHRNVFGVNL